jgi:hypothetical protein
MPSFAITEIVVEAATIDPMGQVWTYDCEDLNRWEENYLAANLIAITIG